MVLAPAPQTLADASGRPRFGTYSGGLEEVSFDALAGPHRLSLAQRLLRQKRWHYTFVSTERVALLEAIVDLGYTANAFFCAVDLRGQKLLADESFLSPPGPLARVGDRPNAGLDARFRTLGAGFSVKEAAGRARVQVEISRFRARGGQKVSWKGEMGPSSAPSLTVIAPTADSGVNVTQKSCALPASGTLTVGGERFDLDGGVAGTDYTQGLLARRTAWRWGFVQGRLPDGTALGLNLVEGFNEDLEETNENALWLGNRLVPLPRARFTFERGDYLKPWGLSAVDGAVSLRFTPLHVHSELRDYKVIRSKLVQVVGLFSGTVRAGDETIRVSELPGVTEDQDVLW